MTSSFHLRTSQQVCLRKYCIMSDMLVLFRSLQLSERWWVTGWNRITCTDRIVLLSPFMCI